MSQINGNKIVLCQLFNDEYFFRVPEYQRPYSWEKEHCEQLFDDINDSSRDNEYFIGTIVLQEVEDVGTGKKYDIIDGQQRITTLQILLACLRDYVQDQGYKKPLQEQIYQPKNPVSGIEERVRLEVKDKKFFNNLVQQSDSTISIAQESNINDPQKNMLTAVDLFKEKLALLSQTEV